ncbi:MAG TPA: efflux RND transporter periplasmic adaptor subunit [Bacteroidia bacterium]|nr:efflux RND transporter periplasmic adaptor subunit [Bacteroidia bacterium]
MFRYNRNSIKWSSRFKFLFILLLPGLVFLLSCRSKTNSSQKIAFSMSDTMLQRCRFYKVEMQDVKNQVRLFGKISADNNKLAQVFPVVGGVVKAINVELGDYVTQGQVMASIRSGEIAEYQKERLDAVNDVAMAEKNLQVARDLYAGKLNSEKDVIAAERELEKNKAELARINEIYTIYKLEKGSEYNIYAPISGFVVSKKINQNEQIRSDDAEPLFSIAEINEVWALANVNESDISRIKVGYDVKIKTLAFPDEEYSGKIDKIFNAIDPETKSMKVRVKIPNSDFKLKPFMNCTFNITYSENKQMAAVPSSAVIFDKSKYWVMIFKDRYNVETRKVELYRQLGDITYLNYGVKAGERVISKNALLVYDALND